MSRGEEPRRVHFQSPEYLVERIDAIADLYGTDRTDLLVEAMREFVEETAESDSFQELVASRYYDDELDFETVERLVGVETARRLRLLKADLESEPLDLAAPQDVDVYGGEAESVDAESGSDATPDSDAAETDPSADSDAAAESDAAADPDASDGEASDDR